MKKRWFLCGLVLAVSLILAGCSNAESGIISLPDDVKTVVVIVDRNGSEMEPQELEQTEIDALLIWINQLSLTHRTYDEGKTPNLVWNGGSSYKFNINDNELSFSYVYIDKAYIHYNDEWYEIKAPSTPPLDLDI